MFSCSGIMTGNTGIARITSWHFVFNDPTFAVIELTHCLFAIHILSTDSNSKPTLPLLLSFPGKSGEINILERIGTTYKIFGIFLLNDASGAKIESITKEESQVADMTLKILSRWLQGEGMQPQTWSTLIKVLRKSKLSDLANEIETVITSK